MSENVLDVSKRDNLSNCELIREMVYGLNQPFLYYKQNSSLNRTYVKCKLQKKKVYPTQQQIVDSVKVGTKILDEEGYVSREERIARSKRMRNYWRGNLAENNQTLKPLLTTNESIFNQSQMM